jgi:hypothetical protein
MSKEEQIKATEVAVRELEDHREMKSLAARNVTIESFHDARASLQTIEREVRFYYLHHVTVLMIPQIQTLHARTSIEVILFAVRSHSGQYNRPHVTITSDRIEDFFQLSLKHTVHEVAMKLEAYCISGVQGTYAFDY